MVDLKTHIVIPVICIFTLYVFDVAGELQDSNEESKLLDKLFANYNRMARPVLNSNEPLHINVSFKIQFFNDLDEVRQVMSTYVWILLKWKDSYLTWKPEDHGGLNELTLPPYAIWVPDGYFENNLNSELFAKRVEELKYMRTKHDGDVTFDCTGLLETRCTLDMTYFPFDEHQCSIRFSSFSSDASRIVFHVYQKFPPYRNDAFNNQYMLEKFCFNSYFEKRVLNVSTVEVALLIKRRPTVLVWSLMLPLNLLSVVALMVFALPSEAGEKVSLAITVLLSFTVFQSTVDQMMPDNTNTLPVVALFIGSVTIMTTLSLFMTVIVTRLYFKDIDDPISPWIRGILPDGYLISTTLSRSNSVSAASDDNYNNHGLFGQGLKDADNKQLKVGEKLKVNWQKLSKLIDRTCLYIFSVAYVILAVGTTVASAYNRLDIENDRCSPWKDAE